MSLSANNGTNGRLRQNRAEFHSGCVVCGPNNSQGLKIDFTAADDLSVEAIFTPGPVHCGYQTEWFSPPGRHVIPSDPKNRVFRVSNTDTPPLVFLFLPLCRKGARSGCGRRSF